MLRDRGRISERIISSLKHSGEDSVDSLMATLSGYKRGQETLDIEVEGHRIVIISKEAEISAKEEAIINLKRAIEIETNEKEIEIRRIKTEIDE